jgi:hypothetical protein
MEQHFIKVKISASPFPFKFFNYLSLIMRQLTWPYRTSRKLQQKRYRENRKEREKIQSEIAKELKKYTDAFSLEDK